jgi:hypothetical protein
LYDEMTDFYDLTNIFKDAYGGSGLPDGYTNKRIYLKSACMDVQFMSQADNCIIDVYYVTLRKPSQILFSNMNNCWQNSFAQLANVGTVAESNVANTPFSNPAFCKQWLVTKKVQYLVDSGKNVTLQLRMPKNGYVHGRNIDINRCGLPGWTKGVFWQVRGVPGTTAEVTGILAHSVTYSVQKNYVYALPPGPTDETIGQSK